MLSLETLQTDVSAVLEALVEAAVLEMSRLLEECSARAAQHRDTAPKHGEEERENRGFKKAMTSQFASLMETWTRAAVEKILLMLKVSMGGDEPAAEKTMDLNEKTTKRSIKLKTGRVAGPKKQLQVRRSCWKRKKSEKEVEPAIQKINGNPDNDSGSSSSPDKRDAQVTLKEPETKAAPDFSEDGIVQDAATNSTKSQNKKANKEPIKCPSCEKTFALKCYFDRHFLSHSKPHLCSQCGKRFAQPKGLAAHLRRHTGEKLFQCSDCGTEFSYKSTFNRHMRQHGAKKNYTQTCTLCEGQFEGALALQRHKCSALGKSFTCSLCPKSFECRQSLADHENLHSGERDFVCEMCGERFFSFSSLSTHRVTHTQKQTCCDELGLGCSNLSVLQNHLRRHTGEKRFICDVCGKGCSHQSALKHHMLRHTGERPYVCETCGKRCGHASALQNHMRIHTGQKPGQQAVCGVCGKYLSSMVKLKYHMFVHTGEKPYPCDQCDKKFGNPSNLRAHKVTHSGEKMYGCTVCGRRFTQASSLKLHRHIHTGEKPHRCTVCGKGYVHRAEFKKHQLIHVPKLSADSET
ncbi:hypothetical protein LDENG_00198430 [Lucifuga dentata]|nr:hypothetical protein LDENG_00198430 [Lucifuga dentata]